MQNIETHKYEMSLKFENVKLPPVTDILILGKDYPHGKYGVLQAFKYIAPDEFQVMNIDDNDEVEAVLVDKHILKRIPENHILTVLRKNVFPYISKDEAIKVDLDIRILCENINGEI